MWTKDTTAWLTVVTVVTLCSLVPTAPPAACEGWRHVHQGLGLTVGRRPRRQTLHLSAAGAPAVAAVSSSGGPRLLHGAAAGRAAAAHGANGRRKPATAAPTAGCLLPACPHHNQSTMSRCTTSRCSSADTCLEFAMHLVARMSRPGPCERRDRGSRARALSCSCAEAAPLTGMAR